MRKGVIGVMLAFLLLPLTMQAQMAIGTWRDCLDNTIVYRLQAVEKYIAVS